MVTYLHESLLSTLGQRSVPSPTKPIQTEVDETRAKSPIVRNDAQKSLLAVIAVTLLLAVASPAVASAPPPPLPAHVRAMLTAGGYHLTSAKLDGKVAVYKSQRGRRYARVAERFATPGLAKVAADVIRKLQHGRGGDPGTHVDRVRVWQRFMVLDVHVT